MLTEFFPNEKMLQYVKENCNKNLDRRAAYHEKVCLARYFQRTWIPFQSYQAWLNSMRMHVLKSINIQ